MSVTKALCIVTIIGCVVAGSGALAAPPVPPGQHHLFGDVPQAPALVQDEALPAAPLNPYVPPACAGVFSDVTCPSGFAVNWIEQFYSDGITAGCGTNPLRYCPDSPVKRSEMAVFVEKAMRGTLNWSPGDLGNDNSGLGFGALWNNSIYSKGNTALGYAALFFQSYANGDVYYLGANTAVGGYALQHNQPDGGNGGLNGTGNTAGGYAALWNTTTGYWNTAVGYAAGLANYAGRENTFVGRGADVDDPARVNATAIGSGAIVDSSYKVRIGNGSVSVIEGAVAWSWPSDARLKENILDLDLGLDFVMQLRPVSFTLKHGNGRTDMGFLAQDIEGLLGDGYNVLGIGGDKDRTLSLRGTDLIAPLVKAIQEQQAQITDQVKTIQGQQAQIEALKTALAERDSALQRRLATLEQKKQ